MVPGRRAARTIVAAMTLALALLVPGAARAAAAPRALLVGTYNGIPGQYTSIQAAVDAAGPGDWVLVGPGDYHEQADHRANRGPQPAETPAGVVISTPGLHLRGMDRNGVVVDGTKPGAPQCSTAQADQDLGPAGPDGKPLGRNGILIWKANNTWVENLTTCNFLGGAGNAGNQIWWNGGDGSGQVGLHGFWGDYLNGTSTYFAPGPAQATYALFTSNSGDGIFDYTYGSNMNDSNYYVGACQQICNTTIDHAWSQYGALGYSGTNSGGTLIVKNSEFDHNKDGFDTNSQDNSDAPSPQDGSCPNGAVSPITHTHSCWVFMNNYVHDNNNPDVPGAGVAAAGPVGTGVSISGGRNDTIMDNRFENNGAWGIIFVPYPDTETPPPPENCQGGIYSRPPSDFCLFDDWGNAIIGNTFKNNGGFKNDTNGDFAELTSTAAPTNCFHGNTDASGTVTSSPSGLEQSKPVCDGHTVPPDSNPAFFNQVACDSQFFAGIAPGVNSTPCTPGSSYPQRTKVVMPPLPTSQLVTMPDPCAGAPANAWCSPGLGLPAAPSAKTPMACVSGRHFTVHVLRKDLRKATVFVNGRRVRVLSGRRLHARVDLRGLPAGRFSVRIVGIRRDGKRVVSLRTYHTCTSGRAHRRTISRRRAATIAHSY
jgi:hypothetical protein